MRSFSQFITEASLDIQDDSINYIPVKELEDYLKLADRFICQEAKDVIQWLIEHNSTYVKKFGKDTSKNALAQFFASGMPSDPTLKPLYKNLATLNKRNHLLQVPVFMTAEQFDDILAKKISIDEIVLDLESPEGRNAVTKQYAGLINKICSQFVGVSNYEFDDLLSAAHEAFVLAMNAYGKPSSHLKSSYENVKTTTFRTFAGSIIRNFLYDEISKNSRTVRIPKSVLLQQKAEQGHMTRSNTISGDRVIGNSHSDDKARTVWDTIEDAEDTNTLDDQDSKKIWKQIYSIIKQNFDAKIYDAWASFHGFDGHEKLKNKEIAQKYGISASLVTHYNTKVFNFIKSNKKLLELMSQARELQGE